MRSWSLLLCLAQLASACARSKSEPKHELPKIILADPTAPASAEPMQPTPEPRRTAVRLPARESEDELLEHLLAGDDPSDAAAESAAPRR
ncbi:MAG TPA: hypothetical protein VK524_31065 [Polyangiaceae bacterium]|nr:hypothetical protein [Polyangiaceae bacterium]